MTETQRELYNNTAKRLARCGATDPTAQIIALAEEIERYREKIRGLETKATLAGYDPEHLLLVSELLQRHNVTPDDLQDLKDNFQRAWDILAAEAERIRNATLNQMLKDFQAAKEGEG